MNPLQQFSDDEVAARRYDYGDRTVLAVDFGKTADSTVDIVDDTAIVVVGDEQYDLEVPSESDVIRASIRNGILSIEVEE